MGIKQGGDDDDLRSQLCDDEQRRETAAEASGKQQPHRLQEGHEPFPGRVPLLAQGHLHGGEGGHDEGQQESSAGRSSDDAGAVKRRKRPREKYTCEHCAETFTNALVMRQHISVMHSGNKPVQCK